MSIRRTGRWRGARRPKLPPHPILTPEIRMTDPNNFPGNRTVTVGANDSTTVGEQQQVTVGKKMRLVAGDEIELRVGASRLLMRKDGSILISGRDITIESSGAVHLKSNGNIVMKGSKIVQN
jgi:uncharacterized protein (DUF2345 family)